MKKPLIGCCALFAAFSFFSSAHALPRLCTPFSLALDADQDCLPVPANGTEEVINTTLQPTGTNAVFPDTDFDGLVDGDEVFGSYGFTTTPTDFDTDDDGLSDGFEIELNSIFGPATLFDPTDRDTDGDGILDSGELLNGSCGNGAVQEGEQCDEGDQEAGDGCSPFCFFEICGNGILDGAAGEQCDDGDTNDGDGCDAECRFEVVVACGDGTVQGSPFGGQETCDDGNQTPGDGCDAACRSERCGDGVVQRGGIFFEECDDGNTEDGDGCDSLCQVNVAPVPTEDADPDGEAPGEGNAGGNVDEVQGSGCALHDRLSPSGQVASTVWGAGVLVLAALGLRRRAKRD